MGQTIGKELPTEPSFSPFINLPKSIIVGLLCAVSEVSEIGYTLTQPELEQILQLSLHEYFSDENVREYSNALFTLFNADALPGCDCDEIDSFELLGTLCLTSGMPLKEKARFLFDLFDLNEKGELNINEVTLAFRSLVSGTKKIAVNATMLTEDTDQADTDQVALEAFELIMPDSLKYSLAMADDQKLTRQKFFDYVFNCPEAVSFMNCYDDIIGTKDHVAAPLRSAANKEDEQETKQQPLSEPWRDQQRFLRPEIADERPSPPPMEGLRLEHVCGRNSGTEAVYTSNGDVIYDAGSMVIKLVADGDGYKQVFFNEHSNRVSSLTIFHVNEMGDMVASSDTGGDDCKVCVWASHTLSSQVSFSTRHQNGVSTLSFSPSGELLLTMGNNEMNSTIGVYKWRERRLLFTARLPGLGFYDCSFLSSDYSFGLCGKDLVHFWTQAESHEPYRHYRGSTNLFPSQVQMTSIACVDGAVVTGSTSGALWLWEGRVLVKRVEVFRFPITKLFASRAGLFVSTQDGTIHLLSKELALQQRLDPFSRSDSHGIETLCWDTNREKLLVGDSSNCLREMGLNSASKFVMGCHSTCHSALTDFTIDTLNDNIITVGEDGFIRKWDKDARVILQQHSLERGLSCIAFNQGIEQVAVGFCKSDNCCSSDKIDVAFVILCSNDLTNIIHHGHNSQKTLTACKFSNDGKLVAFGAKDCSIYIHSTDKDFPLVAKARGHSAPILTFDFGCADDPPGSASFLRSNSINGEALYWSTHAKKQTPLSQRHTRWESQSCIYGWYLEGAHDLCAEEKSTRVTACCPLSDRSLVVGDSCGRLRVLPNPAMSKDTVYLQFSAHHGKVKKIDRCGDSLYTLGSDDSCLCMWKVSSLSWPPTMPPSLYDDHVIIDEKKEDHHLSVNFELATAQMEDLDFSTSHAEKTSSTHKPLRPWMRSIVPPSNYTPQLGPLPDGRLVLEHIHGYNGHNAKNNLHYISSGESIVYSVGKTLVRYDEEGDTQHFCSVEGRINCLAIHQERSLCAIGQEDADGIVIVDLKTMNYMSLCKSTAKGIQCLDFDESGRHLLALGGNRLTIHDVDNEVMIASTLTHATETLDVRFTSKANALVEVGRNIVRLWFIKGSDMGFEEVDMSTVQNPTTFYTCVGWIGNHVIVGASTGDLIRFAGATPISKIKAHTSKITNISSVAGGKFAISAANSVKLYDSKCRCIIAVDTEVLGVRHQISSLSWHADRRKILIGTEGNEVWELSSEDGSNINDGSLVSAHASSPMATSAHPNGTTFATVADDGFLRVWNDENTSLDLAMPSRACAYSPDGRMLAVGFGKPVKDTAKTINGKWVIIDVSGSSYCIIAERRDSRKFIREMKWYSNGDRLAVGSDKIYVYQLASETNPALKVDISLVSTIDMNSPPIHFDFSKDGKYLRVNSEANELMWFESDPAIRISEASLMKDTEWESDTCVFGWNVQGTHHPEGPNVRSLDCYTEDCSSVVTGGDDGVLRMYSYPCTSTRSNYLSYIGHDGAVTSVMILKGGSHVISAGDDHAIMIWRHEIDDNYGDHLVSERQESSVIDAVDAIDMCCTALYGCADQIIYPTSGVCVVMDAKRSTQNLFQQHNSQIGAVATSSSRQLVASGDSCSDFPTKIWIWDPQTCTEIASLSDSRLRGVSVLAFSPDENRLACVSSDENHRIFVWTAINGNWNNAYLSAYSLGGHEKISFVQFTQTQLITGGRNSLNFWSFVPNLSVSKGVVSTQSQDDTLLCGAMVGDTLLTGTSKGSFVTWDLTEKKIAGEVKAHNSSVTSLLACPEGIVSGSSDGLVTLWVWSSEALEKKRSFDVGTTSAIHSLDICPHSNGGVTMKILAVSDSTCFEISCVTGRVTKAAKIPTAGEESTC